jgi:error-prone DNA polymerase
MFDGGVAMSFIHLHVHSNFSFKDSTLSVEDIALSAQRLGMPAVAITDHDNLCGAVRFYGKAKEVGVKPIIGVELETTEGHLTLLAENYEGYGELCQVVSRRHLEGVPVSPEYLAGCKSIIVLSGCDKSGLVRALSGERPGAFATRYKEMFGDCYYIELQNHHLDGDRQKVRSLRNMALKYDIPIVGTNDVHFQGHCDWLRRDILAAMKENVNVTVPKKAGLPNSEYGFKSSAVMCDLFNDYVDSILNTAVIADRCNVKFPEEFRFPRFPLPDGRTAGEFLRSLCLESLERVYSSETREAAHKRLDHELSIIDLMGFNDYFLVVWDIVSYARKRGIRFAGRGSAADSLVSFLLGVTHVDPIHYNLLFERFLNPERKGMPDVDIDFDSNRRDEVIDYIFWRYGKDMVAMVCTVNTINARSGVREVAKALGYDAEQQSSISKKLPHCRADKIETAIEVLPELQGEFTGQEETRTVFRYAASFSDFPRHLGVHNGGVIIADQSLSTLTPLQYATKGVIISQHDKDDVEKLGLVKMDLLGLKMLSIIEDTQALVRQNGQQLDIDNIPSDDAATYALLRSTDTVGLFQLESPGMRELLGRLQPTEFEDIIANISLFRPGPMQGEMIAPYIARRHGREQFDYMHSLLEPALKDTYGVIIYQEQVLQIGHLLAGFTLGQADLLRRAMTKNRSAEEMAMIREQFITGAKRKGVAEKDAAKVFEKVAGFAAYGFNKAHAASFGWIAYQSAYLKAHHPVEFLCATLNNQPCGFYPPQVIAWEAKRLGIPVLPPDICRGDWDCTLEDGGIRIGLKYVIGMSTSAWARIKENRESDWEGNLLDGVPDKIVANLARVGAIPGTGCADRGNRANAEFAVLGMTVSDHPLALMPVKYTSSRVVEETKRNGEQVSVAGIVISRQTPPTRSGRRIIFLTMQDDTGLVDVTVFPDIQDKYAKTIYRSSLLKVDGVVRKTGVRGFSVTAQRVFAIA